MTNQALLAELKEAPCPKGSSDMLGRVTLQEWKWGPLTDGWTATVIDQTCAEHGCDESEAVSLLVEQLERQVAIAACEHLPDGHWSLGGPQCDGCPAEYHNGAWV